MNFDNQGSQTWRFCDSLDLINVKHLAMQVLYLLSPVSTSFSTPPGVEQVVET